MPRLLALLVAVAVGSSGCIPAMSGLRDKKEDAPSHFSQVTSGGLRYAHNWPDRPCFTVDLAGNEWQLVDSNPDNVQWKRGEQVLRVYLTDNRTHRFGVKGQSIEEILRSFIAYESEYVQPMFDFFVGHPPRTAEDYNGVWIQWGWEGHGGKRRNSRVEEPANQRHVIHSLWVDPWVLSLDWATTDMAVRPGATPAALDTLESLTFYPKCFAALEPGATW